MRNFAVKAKEGKGSGKPGLWKGRNRGRCSEIGPEQRRAVLRSFFEDVLWPEGTPEVRPNTV